MKRVLAALALAGASLSAPAFADDGPALRADLGRWQERDSRLNAIGWRLTTGNARFCEETRPAIGLLLRDAAGFADPAAVRSQTGAEITVEAVAPGSPAAEAGLRAGDAVSSIGAQDMGALPEVPASDWRRLARLHEAIDKDLAADGDVEFGWQSAGTPRHAVIAGYPACTSRFEVISGKRASADGSRVAVGRDFAPFAYPDPLLAAAVAHELAHNLLHHRAWLDAHGRSRANVRLTEHEADRLAPWLLANAGYPPEAMLDLMRRWGPDNDGGLFRKRDHEGWDERAETIAAEIEGMAQYRTDDGSSDWSRHFVRDTAR